MLLVELTMTRAPTNIDFMPISLNDLKLANFISTI